MQKKFKTFWLVLEVHALKKNQVGWELKKRKAYTCIYLMYMWGKWWWNRLL